MSAYVVNRKHIVYLMQAAISHRLASNDGGSISWRAGGDAVAWNTLNCTASAAELARVGNMLWRENVRSVKARYPDEKDDSLPGPIGEDYTLTEDDFGFVTWMDFDPVQVIKSIHCFQYQSCESDNWETTEAYRFVAALEGKAEAALPGYDEAQWGAPDTQAEKEAKARQVIRERMRGLRVVTA